MAMTYKNYTLGRGKFRVASFLAGTQSPDGFRYMGNTPSASIAVSSDELEHFDSDQGVNEKDDSVSLTTTRTMSLTTDNIVPENLALYFFGQAETVAQTAQAGLTEVLEGVHLDYSYRLGMSNTNVTGFFGLAPTGFAVTDGGATAKAQGTVTFAGVGSDGDTVTVGGQGYTLRAAAASPFEVTIGATATDTANNLRAAINAGAGAGTAYGAGTVANSVATAVSSVGGVVTIEALNSGSAGNTIALAKSGADISVSGATLTGGSGTVYVQGTDYTLEAEFGLLTPLSTGSIAEGADLTVEYGVRASIRPRVLSGNTQREGALMYEAINPKGDNNHYYMPYVRIRPDGDYQLKGDTWQEIPLTVEILKPRAGGAAVIMDGAPLIQ